MEKLTFYLHVYRMLLIQDAKSKMSYKADFIISTIGLLLTNIAGFATFYIIFQKFDSILGWTYYEMLFMYGFSLIVMTPLCLFENNWNLLQYLRSGDFNKYYLRPVNIYFYFISEVFDPKGLGQSAIGIISLVYAWEKIGLTVNVASVITLIINIITASIVMIGMMNMAAACGFWLIGYNFVMILTDRIKNYGKYPITIFNLFFRIVFTFILPIGFLGYYQNLNILRADEVSILTYISPIFSIIFTYLSYRLWIKGTNSYNGTGS